MAKVHNIDAGAVPRPIRVGVIVNNVGGYSRAVIRGIASFATSRGWTCRAQGVNVYDLAEHPRDFDGLIVQADDQALREIVRRTPRPVVNVSSAIRDAPTPSVVTDDRLVGRLGADHLLRRGHRRLVFFGPDLRPFTDLRHAGFTDRAAEADLHVDHCRQIDELADLLDNTDGTLGVMGCNDRAGLAALDLVKQLGLRVPDDIAILGVDNDDLMQALADPPLSTINTARERIGFEAAALLERLIAGDPAPNKPVLVPPRGVLARRSTDAFAIHDNEVEAALRFLHTNAARPIGVDDITAATTLGRRQLERRFRDAMGRSMIEELRRARVERARSLLAGTDLTLPQVADAAGFASASYFSTVFHRELGTPPDTYRRTAQNPARPKPG